VRPGRPADLCPTAAQTLTVGAVGVEFRSPDSLVDLTVPAYASFLGSRFSPGACLSTIELEVLEGECPPSAAVARFDTSGGLSVQTEEDGYRLRLHRRDVEEPHTTVCCDRDTTQVKVYLGDEPDEIVALWGPRTGYLATLVLRMVVMNHLASRGGVVVHAAGGVIEGKALVFPGVSTAGKSTLMQSFLDAGLADSLLSDDRMIVRRCQGEGGEAHGFAAWGTPWSSGARIARNASAPLEGLLFLVKAADCKLVPLSGAKAMQRLLPTVSYPWYDEERSSLVLETCACLVQEVPCYELHFKPGEDVVKLLTDFTRDAKRPKGPGVAS